MTALPTAAELVGPVTEGDFKTALTAMRDFQAGLLGTDGINATALASLGALAGAYTAKTAAYSVVVADRGKLIDATTGSWTLSLPTVASAGSGFSVMLRNSGTGIITIDPSGSELVNGVTTLAVAAGDGAVIACTGTAWVVQRVLSPVMTTTEFELYDPTDSTKRMKFKCDGITPGTTHTIGIPNNSGNMVLNNQSTTTIGNLATTTTVNVGVGVTTTGVTKTVNIGPLGLSGSITNVSVGSAVSGALGTTTFNSPTVAFAASVTAINLPDVATFLVDSADATKKAQFELSGITTGTTRTFTLPNASGTVALDTTFTSGAKGLAPASGGGSVNYMRADGIWAAPGGGSSGIFPDATFRIQNNADATKQTAFDSSGITTGTTRTVTMPNASGTMVLDTATQTLTNKSIAVTQLTGTLLAAQEPAHTGDVTNSAGSLALTLATVNSNVGSFGLAGSVSQITVNAKGLITAAANVAISIAAAAISDATAAGRAMLTAATVAAQTALLDVFTSTTKGLAPASGGGTANFLRADGSWAAPSGGGITSLTTDVVASGSGAVVATIQPGVVSLAKMADVATATVFYRKTAATGSPEVQTLATLKADLGLTGTNSGDQTITLTSDVTGSGTGSFPTTIAAGAVSLPKMANMATSSLFYRKTAGSGAPEVQTLATLKTDLGLTGTNSGDQTSVVGITGTKAQFDTAVTDGNFLYSGDVAAPAGSTTQIQYNNAGAMAGATEIGVEGNQLRLEATSSFTAPASGGAKLVGRTDTGRTVAAMLSQDGVIRDWSSITARSHAAVWKTNFGSSNVNNLGGGVLSATGTPTASVTATTSLLTYTPRVEYLVTVAATTAVAGWRYSSLAVGIGGTAASLGGFAYVCRWSPSTGVATTTNRAFVGMTNSVSAPTDVEPSTLTLCVGMGWDAADTNIQMMHNDGSGTCTKIDLGASFPVPTTDRTSYYELSMYSPKGTSQSVNYLVTNLNSGATASGTISTNIPATTDLLAPRGWMSVGGTSSVIGLALISLSIDPLL